LGPEHRSKSNDDAAMKGMMFTEFLEMVEERWSAELVDDLLDEVALPSGGRYTAVGTYDHRELTLLVQALGARLGQPPGDLVREFGRHLFGRFVQSHPRFFVDIDDAFEFLVRVEGVIHVEVRKLYSDTALPTFGSERANDHLTLVYRSERQLEDLAHGLIEGCLAHFGERASIDRQPFHDEVGRAVRFDIVRQR
jgi:hypothetical protein